VANRVQNAGLKTASAKARRDSSPTQADAFARDEGGRKKSACFARNDGLAGEATPGQRGGLAEARPYKGEDTGKMPALQRKSPDKVGAQFHT